VKRADKWGGPRVDDGEICTLTNMGPLWIHINKFQSTYASKDGIKELAMRVGRAKITQYYQYQYRLWDTRREVLVCDWLDYPEYRQFVLETIGVTIDTYRPKFVCRAGFRIFSRYEVQVRAREEVVESSKGGEHAGDNRTTGEQ
jgi:hypothetical protein